MKSKSLIAMAGLTAVLTVAAVVALKSRDSTLQGQQDGTVLFPEFKRSLNSAAKLTIRRADGTAVLEKGAKGWGLADKGGYPVEMEPVRKALIVLSEMETIEPKTSSPEQYARLGVEDVTAPDAKSALVTVQDAGGQTLAELIVGKTYESKNFSAEGQCYVRKPGEAQSWLVKGRLDLRDNGPAWLSKKIVEVKRDRIREVEIRHADGESVRAERSSAELTDFTLANIPEGKELQYPTAPGTLASGLEYVNLDDVQPAGGIDFTQEPGPVATFRTFDGLRIEVACKEQDGKTYARFSASFEEPPAVGPEPQPAPDEAANVVKTAKKSPEEVRQEVDELNARFAPWTFVISSYNRSAYYKRAADLLKDKAPPAPPPGSAPPDGGKEETYKIPDNLPKEIQDQIKADLEAKGQKWEVVPAPPEEGGHEGHDHGTPPPAPVPAPAPTPGGGTPPH